MPDPTPMPTDLRSIPRSAVLSPGTLACRRTASSVAARFDQAGTPCWTPSGRLAIHQALRLAGVGPGDRVLYPTYHCPTMIEPAVLLGAQPLFYPLAGDGRPDLGFLTAPGLPRAKALLAAHYFGLPRDFAQLVAWCAQAGVTFIEDCAHAFFGQVGGHIVGTQGDLAIASLPKFFAVHDGGCLVVPRSVRAPELAAPGVKREVQSVWDVLQLSAADGHFGFGSGMINALVAAKARLRGHAAGPRERGDAQPEAPNGALGDDPYRTIDPHAAGQRATRFAQWVVAKSDAARIGERRRRNFARYVARLTGAPGLRALYTQLPEQAVPYVFPVWVDRAADVYARARTRGMPVYRWDVVWPGTPMIDGDVGPSWSQHVFQLACHQDMSESDIDAVADALKADASQAASPLERA